MVRDLAATGQECIRTLKSERNFQSDIWRTFQSKDLKLTKIAKNSHLLKEFDIFTCAPWRTWCRSGQFLPIACTYVQDVYTERIPRSRIDVLVFKCTTAFFTRAWGKCTVSIRAEKVTISATFNVLDCSFLRRTRSTGYPHIPTTKGYTLGALSGPCGMQPDCSG